MLWVQGALVVVMVLTAMGILYVLWESLSGPGETPLPTATPLPLSVPYPSPTPRPKVGIVAGHWESDTGAICPDGLTEVEINLDVARRVVAMLNQAGYDAQVLPEFSPQLIGYRADAFVSIHSDSCEWDLSGFKVARVSRSAIPEEEDRLVECLRREYARITGLRFHKYSITYDMTDYHAFYEIDHRTPGAIIEIGFMSGDRELLTKHPDVVAKGIVQGIICFLEGP